MIKKRFLSAALALMMLLTLLPTGAFAADVPEPEDNAPVESASEPAEIASEPAEETNEAGGGDGDPGAFVFVPGVIPEETDLIYPKGETSIGMTSPVRYDGRTNQSPVRNQGSNGLCWSFGTYGVLESYMKKNGFGSVDFSELHMGYSLSNSNGNTVQGYNREPADGGNRWMSSAYLMRGTSLSGTVNETDDPYVDEGNGVLPARALSVSENKPKTYTAQNFLFLTGGDKATQAEINEIKSYIMSHGGVGTCMLWDNGAYDYNTNSFYYYDSTGEQSSNHIVEIVGWDDTYSKNNFGGYLGAPSKDGAWLVRNSWGEWWGDNGYFWISYEDQCVPYYVFAIDGVKAYDDSLNVYETDYVPGSGYYSVDNSYYFGRGYKTQSANEIVKSVRILLEAPATVEVGVSSARGLSGYKFKALASKDCQYPGWYTFEIPEASAPVFGAAGTEFSVVVKLTANSYNSSKQVRLGYDHMNASSSIVSYWGANGSSWSKGTANLCIKAVTAQKPLPNVAAPTLADGTSLNIVGEGTVKLTNPDNATIYYTLDGTDPATSGTRVKYTTKGIALDGSTPRTNGKIALWIYAEKLGMKPCKVEYAFTYEPWPPLAAPVITVNSSTAGKATVTITQSEGATIYYTTNGDTPTAKSTRYSKAITLTENATIKAIAVMAKRDNSPVASSEVKVTVAAPVANPNPDKEFKSKTTVKLTSTTKGAEIWYTLNGGAPMLYTTKGIALDSDAVITAYARKANMETSATVTFQYTKQLEPAAKPAANPKSGTFTGEQNVVLTSTSGATIYYTLDGTVPTTKSASISSGGSIKLDKNTPNTNGKITIKAFATGVGVRLTDSAVVTFTYTRKMATATVPAATPKAGTFTVPEMKVELASTGDTIYYTLDGSDPTKADNAARMRYDPARGIMLDKTTTIKACAVGDDMIASKVATLKFTQKLPTLAAPAASPKAGTFSTLTTDVVLSCADPGATIYYTLDGSTPTENSTRYTTGPITLSETTTIKAFAKVYGKSDSKVVTFKFTQKLKPLAAPTADPKAGTFTTPTTNVKLSCAGYPDAEIWYTLDGSDPTKSNSKFAYDPEHGITLAGTTTIKAYAKYPGLTDSKVATFKFTQKLPALAAPTASPKAGTFTTLTTDVVLSCTDPGATIYYTLDGSTPTENSTRYTGPITLSGTTTIKAFAKAYGKNDSKVVTFKFTQKLPTVTAPTITASKKTSLTGPVDVTLSSKTAGAMIVYTLDGSDPLTSGSAQCVENNTKITLDAPTNTTTVTLRAIAVNTQVNPAPSKETKAIFTWKAVSAAGSGTSTGGAVEAPASNPADGIDAPADVPEDVIDIPVTAGE